MNNEAKTGGVMLTEEELKAIDARANAATPGPWTYDRSTWVISGERFAVASVEVNDDATAAFVCAARTDIPALREEVRRLQSTPRYDTAKVDALLEKWDLYCSNDEETDEYTVGLFMEAVRASREPGK